MKTRHLEAKRQKEYFEKTFGEDTKTSYSDFMKKETPITRNIVTYEVSYQLNYRGEGDSMIIAPKTFKVVAFEGQEHDIYSKTMNMVTDSKGAMTGDNFQSGTIGMIEDNLKVDVKRVQYPRGMERSQKKPTREEVNNLLSTGFSVSAIDKDIKFKNKKGGEGRVNLDMRHF